MTISYRILKGDGDNRIEFRGRTYAEDELTRPSGKSTEKFGAVCRRTNGSKLKARSGSTKSF